MGFDLIKSVNALPELERRAAWKRIASIHREQRELGMEPRNDSQLTFKYAIKEIDDAPREIANELMVVDRIYNDTEYSAIIEDVLREIAHHIKRKYNLSWSDTWELVRFYGPTMLKLYCLKPVRNR